MLYYRIKLQEQCIESNSYHIVQGVDKLRSMLDQYQGRDDIAILGVTSYFNLIECIYCGRVS